MYVCMKQKGNLITSWAGAFFLGDWVPGLIWFHISIDIFLFDIIFVYYISVFIYAQYIFVVYNMYANMYVCYVFDPLIYSSFSLWLSFILLYWPRNGTTVEETVPTVICWQWLKGMETEVIYQHIQQAGSTVHKFIPTSISNHPCAESRLYAHLMYRHMYVNIWAHILTCSHVHYYDCFSRYHCLIFLFGTLYCWLPV